MNKSVDETILRKIKKALDTAAPNSGASEQEKETAMLLAQKLMVKHGIEMSELQDSGEAVKKEIVHGYASEPEKRVWWKGALANIIAENFRCFNYFTQYKSGALQVRFLGVKEDVEIAVEVYKYACKVIDYHSKKYLKERKKQEEQAAGVNFKKMNIEELEKLGFDVGIHIESLQFQYGNNEAIYKMRLIMAIKDEMGISINPTALKNDYIAGFLKGLKDKFKEQVDKEGWGLVLVKDSSVKEEFEKMEFKMAKPTSAKGLGDAEARAEGYKQGKKFEGVPKGEIEGEH